MHFSPKNIEARRDPCRPRYHFLPPGNWMNDPCGLIQWNTEHHLFYQYNPNGARHGTIHWGHGVSNDLVHWRHLPIALAPTPGGPDEDGCWTGCAVDYDGIPALVYTGVFPQTVCVAKSGDNMLTWQKYKGNPVIEAPPHDLRDQTGGHFRDPFVWWEEGCWYLIIGSKVRDVGCMVLLYRSQDLIDWEYLHPLLAGDVQGANPFLAGRMWECPSLLNLGDKRALLISIQTAREDRPSYTVYHSGPFEDERFVSESQGILVHGGYFYAPQAMHLDDGRYVLWGWLREGREQHAVEEAGWAGVMSLPLAVSAGPDGRLAVEPVRELQALRRKHWHYGDLAIEPEPAALLDDVRGNCLEISAEFELTGDEEFGLLLCCSPDGQEQTRLVYQSALGQIVIEREDSSLSLDVDRGNGAAPVDLSADEPLKLHIFLDRSVIEVFVNGGRSCLASRIYPLRPDSLGIGLFARSGSVKLKSLDIWKLSSIWA